MPDLKFNVSAETAAATAKLGAFAQDIQNKLVNAVRALPDIEINADSTDAQKEVKRIRDAMAALADKKVGVDISAEDALAEMQRLQTELRTLGSSTTELQVRADVAEADRALGNVEEQVRRLGGQDVEVDVDASTEGAEKELGGFKAKGMVLGAAAGAAIGGVLTSAMSTALDVDAVNRKLQAQLGVGSKVAKDAGEIAGKLYAQNYGENLGEVGDAVQAVLKSGAVLETDSKDHIQAVTGKVMSLSQTFDQDLGGTVNAVAQMIRTGLAKNADDALDILTTGFQAGDDKAEDLLDTMNEYGVQFQKVGIDGGTAMGLIRQGLQGGARDADLVADAIKEFSIRAVDGSDSTADGFKKIGLNAQDMATRIGKGGDTAKAALDETLDRLRNIKDPTQRAAAATELFGTQAEDLGKALFGLDPSTAKLNDVAGAAQKLDDTVGDTANAKVEKLKRSWELWTASLVSTKGPIGDVAGMIEAYGPTATDAIGMLAPLVVALKMNGVVGALRGVSAAEDEVAAAGSRAAAAGAGPSRMMGLLKGVGIAAALGGIAYGLDQINVSAAGGAENLKKSSGYLEDMVDQRDTLHDLVGGVQQLFTDPGSVFTDIGDEWDGVVRKFQTGTSDVGRWWGDLTRELSGFHLEPIDIPLTANPKQALSAADSLRAQINKSGATVDIGGNTQPAGDALEFVLKAVANGVQSITIDGDTMPAGEALDYLMGRVNTAAGDVTFNGQDAPASDVLRNLLLRAGQIPAVVPIDGNWNPALQKLQTVITKADGSKGTVTLDGDPKLVNGKTQQAVTFANGSKGTITLQGNPDPATGTVKGVVTYANGQTASITVKANADQAWGTINGIPRNIYITAHVTASSNVNSAGGLAAGGIIAPGGAVLYAAGGVDRPMTRMPVGVPAIAEPGHLRVFGDRSDVNESYIPWKRGSARAVGLLRTTARALGYVAVPAPAMMAAGGVAAPSPGSTLTAAQAAAGWFQHVDGSVDNVNDPRWAGPGLDAWRRATQSAAVQQASTAAAVSAATSTATGGFGSSATSGPIAVVDAAVKATLDQLRQDLARSSAGTQLVLGQAMAAAVRPSAGSGNDRAASSRRVSREGAW